MPTRISPPRRITVGSRSSPLAMTQTEEVLSPLRLSFPDIEFVVVPVSTRGDRQKEDPLLSMDRGMFVREIENALTTGEIDLAIHSAKDVPIDLAPGLAVKATAQRQDARDVLVNRWGAGLDDLPAGARLGTSSPRRTAQLKAARPDIELLPIRGNVGTRLEKGRGPDYDGVVLAAAGLHRLGDESVVSEYLSADVCTPDVGQGTLVAEYRADDKVIAEVLDSASHDATVVTFEAERAFLAEVGGGCKSPVAAYALLQEGGLRLTAMAALPDGSRVVRIVITREASDPSKAGRLAADALMGAGGRELIQNDG